MSFHSVPSLPNSDCSWGACYMVVRDRKKLNMRLQRIQHGCYEKKNNNWGSNLSEMKIIIHRIKLYLITHQQAKSK